MRARRRPFIDEYVEGGESAVLIDDNVVVLSALATSILATLRGGWILAEGVAEVLAREYGEPPGGELVPRTERALQCLAEQGLIELSG